jgi:molybdopterin-biosynthesis enzyme MoeA-like protein
MAKRRAFRIKAMTQDTSQLSQGAGEEGASLPPITAALLIIGDEILSGRVADVNIATVARHLTAIGIRLCEARVVGDVEAEIVRALNALRGTHDYVFTTGGIGPTHDDITVDAVGKAFGVAVELDPRSVALLRQHYPETDLTPARLRMARLPAGAELVEEARTVAPGFMIENVVVMAGVPSIMKAMLHAITPRLRKGARILSITMDVPERESDIAPTLSATQGRFADIAMGSYPYAVGSGQERRWGAHLVLRGADVVRLQAAADALAARLAEAGLRVASVNRDE